MIIARQKKKENIAEYILYMWQIEDIIRAYNLDLELIKTEVISQFDIEDNEYDEMVEWYDSLIQAMILEKVEEKGHIQFLKNIVSDLTKLHIILLESPHHQDYLKKFEENVDLYVELIAKHKNKDKNIIELYLETLYGYMILKLKREQISQETLEAIRQISSLISLLIQKYNSYENDKNFVL